MRQILEDPDRDLEFGQAGCVKVPLLSATEIEHILCRLAKLRPDDDFRGRLMPFHWSFLDSNLAYRRHAFELIESVFAPHIEHVLSGYRLLRADFYVKPPGTGTCTVHQNWPAIGDLDDTTVTIWCPLVDVDESNGALQIVEGSHKLLPHVETPNSPAYFESFTNVLIRRHLRPVAMAAGEALVFDDSLIHWSAANDSELPRVAVGALCIPKDATPAFFHKADASRFELIEADREFFLTYSVGDLFSRQPEWGSLGFVEDRNRPVSATEFADLLKESAVRRGHVPREPARQGATAGRSPAARAIAGDQHAQARDDFVVLLARQRSGTHALASVLAAHPDVLCLPEVFHDDPSNMPQMIEANWANFVAAQADGDLHSVLSAESHRELFRAFLDRLRRITDKRYVLIDVKYNATHHVSEFWRPIGVEPFLFSVIRSEGIRVLHLTRHNHLRHWVSMAAAHQTREWTVNEEHVIGGRASSGSAGGVATVTLDVRETLAVLEQCRLESAIVASSFAGYPHYLELEYDGLFSEIGAPLSEEALSRIQGWLGLGSDFEDRRPNQKKQSAMPLAQTIANYDEIAAALTGTPFQPFLADERMYRVQAESPSGPGMRASLIARAQRKLRLGGGWEG